ncbi:MAG: DEAD/DEAH box helicase, partial [Lachnoclostridium sp.]|nr:DEAD/DEAH box helicase [Lachnoclostridium sp.]
MRTLLDPLKEWEEFVQLKNAVKKKESPLGVTGCVGTAKSHFIYGLSEEYRFKVIIAANEIQAKEWVEDYRLYDKTVCYYPAKDLIFYSADVHGQAIVKERLKIIKRIAEDEPCTIITTLDGGMDFCLPFFMFERYRISVTESSILDLDHFRKSLTGLGYEHVDQVEQAGQFSVRGGIVDVFSLTEDNPFRIELWGDEVDTIRLIDVESQRSVERLKEITIYPATEIFASEDEVLAGLRNIRLDMEKCVQMFIDEKKREQANRLRENINQFLESYDAYQGYINLESYIRYFSKTKMSFFDYFADRDAIFFMDEPTRCIERCEAVEYEFRESMVNRLEKGYILPDQMDVLFSLPSVLKKIQNKTLVLISALNMTMKDIPVKRYFNFTVQSSPSYNNNFALLANDIAKNIKNGGRLLVLSASETRGRRLLQDLEDYGVHAFYSKDMNYVLKSGDVMISRGSLRRGFEYPNLSFIVVTESDIFGGLKKKKKKKHRRFEGVHIHSFHELKIGDYVVHENHGLGIYQGIEKIEMDKITKDYLKIKYAGNSNLYILATGLDVLQKYAGSDSRAHKLNNLNSPEWKKTKSRVKGAVDEIAKELVELYAKRQKKSGFSFEKDTVWQREFEELFPYEETDDQLTAIEATKEDMESRKIMDRLICGDVGYGKTEIAIRAAFKAVQDGKQVAFLVPTTILAGQHYNTFLQRMKDFPISVDMISRLRTSSEQKVTLRRLRKGSLDIIVGTHRLLSKDIEYKDLGLLIVDEEQRFGVTHKEKIKKLKSDIDVLTLTATPIPRTLHMSLIGIRDMSVLEEAPMDRMPIQTFVMEKNDEIVREAIIRELGRGGQVYYVYNRVANMDIVAGE